MTRPPRRTRDLTELAVPGYFAAMGLEYLLQRRRAARRGPTAGTYERRDTVASLAMGTASLLAPIAAAKVLGPLTPGRGRYGRVLLGATACLAAVTVVADRVSAAVQRRSEPPPRAVERARRARQVAKVTAPVAMGLGLLSASTWWAAVTAPSALHARAQRRGWKLSGAPALAAALIGWDGIYYLNHRAMHTSRFLWAIHDVHHSSQHYNLSTALRQPVADALGVFVPYGLLCGLGIAPEVVATARGVNLLYQFWIHTELIDRMGRAEAVLNTPSHHRVHHGINPTYLDRNHGGILILWDRLLGTFTPETEPVTYGLTTQLDSFRLSAIAGHEYRAMVRDVGEAQNWSQRLQLMLRGPGWARQHRPASAALEVAGSTKVPAGS